MAKKPTEKKEFPLETTKSAIIDAQKEKIGALTEYSKKLKKEVKALKEAAVETCIEIEMEHEKELEHVQSLHNKVLVMAVIGSLVFGLLIGMLL